MTFKTFSIALVLTSATLSFFQSQEALGGIGQTHSGKGIEQKSQSGGNQSPTQDHKKHQGPSSQHNPSCQQTGPTSSPSSTSASPAQNAPSQAATNTYAIEVVYSGTHVGQKLDGGKIVEDSTLPVAHIECGGKSFDISSTEKKLTIPAGTIPATEGPYYKLGADGKFIPTPIHPGRETLPGKALHCNYSTIGHVGFLGELSAKVNRIEIGQTIHDNKFSYGQ